MTAEEALDDILRDTIKYLSKRYKMTEEQALKLLKTSLTEEITK